jgi:putative hydrolase of the HAD superfamily
MTLNEFTPVQAIIWDLDNTLYRFDDAFIHACNVAAARAALHMKVPLGLDEAIEFATRSHLELGFSTEVFIEEHGVDRAHMHEVFHSFIDERAIVASLETLELFRAVKCDHVLLTHGSGVWARRVLDHLGLREFFLDTHILGRENFEFYSKAHSLIPFKKALSVLGRSSGRDILVVEDTAVNLKHPYNMGMQTALIHHGRPPEKVDSYINHSIGDIRDVLKFLRN